MRVRPQQDRSAALAPSYVALVEEEVFAFLARERERMASSAPAAVQLLDEVTALIRAGGKRLRPLFCYWGFRAGGGVEGVGIARVGGALELLHTSAIIHDDVVDRSEMRRGAPTLFRRLSAAGPRPGGGGESFGRSGAVLAGDLAHALADQLLLESGFEPERLLTAFARFNRMRLEAVSGEVLDLLAGSVGSDEREARRIAALKSGSYSVVGPLLVGATLAGADHPVVEALGRYGSPLGEAFQLRDDVLGTFGDPAATGKDRDTDIREGKRTVLVAKAIELAPAAARRLLAERLGRPDASLEEVEEVRAVIRDSGALSETIELIGELARRAKAELAGAPVPAAVGAALRELADLVAVRDA